jgi:hypothetical protein
LGLELVVALRDLGAGRSCRYATLDVPVTGRARHPACQRDAGQRQDMAIAICQCPRTLNALLRSSRVIAGSVYRANVQRQQEHHLYDMRQGHPRNVDDQQLVGDAGAFGKYAGGLPRRQVAKGLGGTARS